MKTKHRQKAELGYFDTENFIVYKKKESIYVEIWIDVKTRFDNLSYKLLDQLMYLF